MTYKTTEEVINLVKAFEEGTLPESEWNHSTRLTIRLYYCLRFSFDQALQLMRDGISRLNESYDISIPSSQNHHETLNTFWMIFIKQFVETSKSYNLAELANQLVTIYNDENLPLQYYSAELLASPDACKHHISPDLDRFYLFVNSARLLSSANNKNISSQI
jgi:hypothetical protein